MAISLDLGNICNSAKQEPVTTTCGKAISTFSSRLDWHNWLKHYVKSRKVVGSSPDEVGIFNLPNPTSRTMALVSTQSLTEMSTRNLPGG
jgi:hypothetical protein